MTRLLNGPVLWLFVAVGCAVAAYVIVSGAQTAPKPLAALTEREATVGAVPTGGTDRPARVVSRSVNVAYHQGSHQRGNAVTSCGDWAMPQASVNRKGCGADYQSVGPRTTEPSLAHASKTGRLSTDRSSRYRVDWQRRYRLEHAHVQRLLQQLRARHVQAHVEARVAWPWAAIVDCETGDGDGRPPYTADWTYNGSSGFDGGPQFEPGTWTSYRHTGEPERAYEASPAVQIAVAERVRADQGWGAWPTCSSKVGLR